MLSPPSPQTIPLPHPGRPIASSLLGVDSPGGADARLEQQEQQSLVSAAMEQITADQRAALILVDMEGYSVAEAAQILGCAPGTVKSRCARGRARLLPLLAPLRQTEQGR